MLKLLAVLRELGHTPKAAFHLGHINRNELDAIAEYLHGSAASPGFALGNEPPRVKTTQLVLLDGVGERKPAKVKPLAGQQSLFM